MLGRIIYGLLGMTAGVFITLKSHKIVDFTGRIAWAEKTFGGAGTYTFIRFVGIAFIAIFFLYMVGLAGIVYREIIDFIYGILGAAG